MSWGHAVSDDLIRWEHLPIAMSARPRDGGGSDVGIFSGTVAAVSPVRTIAGVPDGADLIACYTAHADDGRGGVVERQELAWSGDGGTTWTAHPANPVLDLGRRDFRDPRIFFDTADRRWAMLVAAPHERVVESYASPDGVTWLPTGSFRHEDPDDPGGIVECPDLAWLPVEGTDTCRWVLMYSIGHTDGHSSGRVVYRIGEWRDGTFTADDGDTPRSVDAGRDFYACQLFAGTPPGEPGLGLAWAGGSPYTASTPTAPWRGVMSMPRSFWLARVGDGLELRQAPAATMADLFACDADPTAPVDGAFCVRWRSPLGVTAGTSGVHIRDDGGGVLELHVDGATGRLDVDRRHAGDVDFHPLFAGVDHVVLPIDSAGDDAGEIDITAFVDASIVEVFAARGRAAITSLCFFAPGPLCVEPIGSIVDLEVRRARAG